MSLRYGVLCFFLSFVVLILFLKNYETWTLPIKVHPEKEGIKKSGTNVEGSPLVANQKEPASIESYILISEKNIFNPERKDFPIMPTPLTELPKKPMVRPKIILYGVTLAEDDQYALISNPGRPLQKGEREIMTIKVGDRIGEYQLVKILTDRIIMEAPEDTVEILLYDPKTPKTRISPPSRPMPAEVPKPISPISPAPTPSPRPRVRIAPILPSPSPQMEEREETR
jgi:hypothetical protein